ncbi:MAG: nucleotidyltransferase family protein [Chloroflexota bacterium]
MHAVILAGGLGTRLGPLVRDLPKPMVEIAGRPFLEYLLIQLRGQGYRKVVLCTGHLGELVMTHFGRGESMGLELRYSQEPEARGTAGAIKFAEPLLSGDRWLVMNGDSFFDIDIGLAVHSHVGSGAMATIALARVDNARRYGTVRLGEGERIEEFSEKTADADAGSMINGGIYVLERTILDLIAPDRPVSLEREIFPSLVGHGLHGVAFQGAFVDIGVPEDYLRLHRSPGPLLRVAARS